MAGNGWDQLKKARNGQKWITMTGITTNDWRWVEMAGNGRKCLEMPGHSWKRLEMSGPPGNGCKQLETLRMAVYDCDWLEWL